MYIEKCIEMTVLMNQFSEEAFCLAFRRIKEGDYVCQQGNHVDVENIKAYLDEGKTVRFLMSTYKGSKLEIIASGHGETILLIPGFGYSACQWAHQIAAWAKEYNVLVIHPPGSGFSTLEGDFSFEAISFDFIDALERLGVKWPIHIVSSSWGGMIGQTIAARFPEKVASLTLACSFCEYTNNDNGTSVSEKVRMDFYKINKNELYSFALSCEMLNLLEIKKYADFNNDRINTFKELSHILAPCFIVSGKQDCVINPDQSMLLHSMISGSKFWEIYDAGHFPNITHSDSFNRRVIGFIESV